MEVGADAKALRILSENSSNWHGIRDRENGVDFTDKRYRRRSDKLR